jgi:hypothetical protein
VAQKLDYLRGLVYARSKGYCEKCGGQLPFSWALHHRKLKSRGGKDEVENLVALHHECHNLATDSVHNNPNKATEVGLMVSSWSNPAECPVTLPDGSSVILTALGTYKYLTGKEGWNG